MNHDYKKYLKSVAFSLSLSKSDLYHSKDGNRRLAREVGWCIKDFDMATAEKAMGDSYNYICVIGYNLRPYLDKKEWDEIVLKSYNKQIDKESI